MTASTITAENTVDTPVWRLALASFLPAERRARDDQWIARLPLMAVMLFQTIASLRLSNSAHQDEGLYLTTGHWLRSGDEVYSRPETFFSGTPSLYPVFASMIDSVGGLELVRMFSTLCMVSATLAVYWMTRELFAYRSGHRAGVLAALVFALSAPVIFLGNFATFDAPSFTCLAWAAALAVWTSMKHRSFWWSLPIGGLCALSVLLKYSSAIDVPVILLLTLAGWNIRPRRWGLLARGIAAGAVTVVLLGVSVATWAREEFEGLLFSTVDRDVVVLSPPEILLGNVFTWSGVTLSLMLLGGMFLLRRQPVLALLLLTGTWIAIAGQISIGESTSLHKHIVLGLIFGAPLAGILLSEVSKRFKLIGNVAMVAVLWGALLQGLSQSATLYSTWPNTAGLVQTLDYSVKAMPWIRMVGDVPEPAEYSFDDRTEHWQWTATWENSFTYEGLSGVPAYEKALKDNYFQLAFFDTTDVSSEANRCSGCVTITGELIPQMESFGFEETGKVTTTDGHEWTIWQRFDKLN